MNYFILLLHKILFKVRCFLLLARNSLLIRTLNCNSISLHDEFIINNNEIKITWDIVGCHKIIIKDICDLPGNVKGVKFLFLNSINPIQIIFCGVGNSIIKQINVSSINIKFLNKFNSKISIPTPSEVSINSNHLESIFSYTPIEISQPIVHFEFEEFQLNNYSTN